MIIPAGEVDQAAECLLEGGVVAFPTETVYGLGALASRPSAVETIFEIKKRPKSRALIIHVDSPNAIDHYAFEISDYARNLASKFWPGPLTLIFKAQPHIPPEVIGGGTTVAIRMPSHPLALQLIAKLREKSGDVFSGIAAPSANLFGAPPPTNAQQVESGLNGEFRPDLILDGGECPEKIPSTILDCLRERPRVLRDGATARQEIERFLNLSL